MRADRREEFGRTTRVWQDCPMSTRPSRSADLLARMQAMPRLAPPVAALVLFLIGAFAPVVYAVPALVLLIRHRMSLSAQCYSTNRDA